MADEVYRPQKTNVSNLNKSDLENLPENHPLRQQDGVANQNKQPQLSPEMLSQMQGVSGQIPPQFLNALNKANQEQQTKQQDYNPLSASVTPTINIPKNASIELTTLLENLKSQSYIFEEIKLPSLGRFYNGEDGPTSGVLHIRPMTGEEEQILATPRFVKKGQAIDMIFQRCIQEKYNVKNLLSVDRTFLLIYLRGISYGSEYEVEIKCPNCDKKFATTIDLDLPVDTCPDSFGPDLSGVLPKSGFRFSYRLSNGKDETDLQEHRERRIKQYGDSSTDDTLSYRVTQLITRIEGIQDKNEILTLVKNLPVQDVAYLRGLVNEPPFGLDTKIPLNCASCLEEFDVDLPLDTGFFFPRRRKTEQVQA
jgi:hypothetical protein